MPGEDTFFIGDETLTAARVRDAKLRRGLGAGPLAWLVTVAGAILGKRIEGPVQQRHAVAFARGVLKGLGYDPETHELGRRRRPFPGFVVRDQEGRAVQFVSEKTLREFVNDPLFLSGYAEEIEA
jgi:hypothetical protein